jgi:hypothetical protein
MQLAHLPSNGFLYSISAFSAAREVIEPPHMIGSGKKAKAIEECEVDTGSLNAMADLEKQVATHSGSREAA